MANYKDGLIASLSENKHHDNILHTYKFSFCQPKEADELLTFIDVYWKKGHAFVRSRPLFDWQHYDSIRNVYNFVLAREKRSGLLHGILGFVPTSQFDPDITRQKVWLCIWIVRRDINARGLGSMLLLHLLQNRPAEAVMSFGLNPETIDFYARNGFIQGRAGHYFVNNIAHEHYDILRGSQPLDTGWAQSSPLKKIERCDRDGFIKSCDVGLAAPYKSKTYYINRFFNHPVYRYICWNIKEHGVPCAFFFTRVCEALGKKVLRLVELVGPLHVLKGYYEEIQSILKAYNAEYIDFVHIGLNESLLKEVGFKDKHETQCIVPNYFEPFIQKNEDILYAVYGAEDALLTFKADSDQDRPSIIPNSI